MGSITLDPEHGVNPGIEQCFVCGGDKGLVLFGKLNAKQRAAFAEAGLSSGGKAPIKVCLDAEPCQECQAHMEAGVVLISVPADEPDGANPRRTGGWVVVRDEYVQRVIGTPALVEAILERRLAFVPDDTWDQLGLPRPGQGG